MLSLFSIKKMRLSEIWLLFPAFILLFVAKLAIKILPFKYLQTKFQYLTRSGNIANTPNHEIFEKAKAINRVASKLPFLQFSCLPKAMALKFWLRKYSEIHLHFGVQKDDTNQLIAHAWLTKNNQIILGDQPNIDYKSIWVWK
jgi:Transglutaminase-like superfamily